LFWGSVDSFNGTSAQYSIICYTLVRAGKYWTENSLKIQSILKLNTTQQKQSKKTQNTAKQN